MLILFQASWALCAGVMLVAMLYSWAYLTRAYLSAMLASFSLISYSMLGGGWVAASGIITWAVLGLVYVLLDYKSYSGPKE